MTYFGVCYGPYREAGWQPPDTGPTEASVDADMKAIAALGFTHVRTYGVAGGNQWNVDKATKYNLRLGLGIEIGQSTTIVRAKALITQALQQGQQAASKYRRPSLSLDLVVGNEVDFNGVQPGLIIDAMKFATTEKRRYPAVAGATVTCCLTGTALQPSASQWTPVVSACDRVVYLTVYPWYAFKAGSSAQPGNIDPNMQWSWANGMQQAANLGKKVVIAEIGWPSDGAAQWLTTVPNEQLNYATTKTWCRGNNFLNRAFDAYWFEMFNEPWKTSEGAWGPHWGLCTSGASPQPKWSWS
ncbi:MAG: hypothetical protein ISP49_20605 [Reyranella sp.]|jgi:exo-beta-1,3-glucanase (GH17 family)|nr:hypothetical protein [Reyranella sp.]